MSNNCNSMDSKKICLYIEPYVHVNVKRNDCLLYNTLNGQMLVYKNNSAIATLLKRMMTPQNLNVIVEEKIVLEQENLLEFIETTEKMQMLYHYDYSKNDENHKKPVSIPPILNFHRERKKMKLDPGRDSGEGIIKYLHKLDIYINCFSGDSYDTHLFNQGYKQFLFPYSAKEYKELDLQLIKQLLNQIKALEFCNITILGGNVFQYKELDGLLNLLIQLPLKKELGVFYKDIDLNKLTRINNEKLKNIPFRIFVDSQPDKNQLNYCIEILKRLNICSSFQFTIQSEADTDGLDEIIDQIGVEYFSIKPFYNGQNFNFFKENIFIQKQDLSNSIASKRDIYARSVMNTTDFGHITVSCNGDVYSNVNEEPLGKIDEDIKLLMLKELSEGKGWFRLRSNLSPCTDCIYEKVCPSLSNYEYALSFNDLCWLHGNKQEN